MLPLLLLAALASAEEPVPSAPPPAGDVPAPAAPAAPTPISPAAPAPVAAPDPAPAAAPAPVAAPAPAPAAAPVLRQEAPPTIVLFPPRAVNMTAPEVRATEILFRRRFELAAGVRAFDEAAVTGAIAASDDKGLLAACGTLGCARWITLDFVRLDKEIFVTAFERDATGAVLQRIETQVVGLNALPGTLDRVARALAANVPLDKVPAAAPPTPDRTETPESLAALAAEPVSSGQVPLPNPSGTYDDSSRPKKRSNARIEDTAGFKFGLHGPNWPNFQLALSSVFSYRVDSKDNFFEVNIGLTLPLGLDEGRTWGMLFTEVGLFRTFPTAGKVAFYAGGGLGPRIGGYDDIGFGAGVYGAAGALLGKAARTRTFVQLRVGGDAFTGYAGPYVVSYTGVEAGVGF
jgi:hypothetical protein